VTTHTAKKAVAAWLAELGLPAHRLTARTVANPFGGYDRVFVSVHDWTPSEHAAELETRAKGQKFFVSFVPAPGGHAFISVGSSR